MKKMQIRRKVKDYFYSRTYVIKIGGKKVRLRLKQRPTSLQQNNKKYLVAFHWIDKSFLHNIDNFVKKYNIQLLIQVNKNIILLYYV
ncbi:MAG: hypothetical protein ACLUVC_14625 [Longibaculum sp.]